MSLNDKIIIDWDNLQERKRRALHAKALHHWEKVKQERYERLLARMREARTMYTIHQNVEKLYGRDKLIFEAVVSYLIQNRVPESKASKIKKIFRRGDELVFPHMDYGYISRPIRTLDLWPSDVPHDYHLDLRE